MYRLKDNDLLIFRYNSYLSFLLCIFTFNLDNYIGIYKEIKNKKYILGFKLTFKYIPKFTLVLQSFENYENEEYYIYTPKKKVIINNYYDNKEVYLFKINFINIITNNFINNTFFSCDDYFSFFKKYYNLSSFNYKQINKNFELIERRNFKKKKNYIYIISSLIIYLNTSCKNKFYYELLLYSSLTTSGIIFNRITRFKSGKRFICGPYLESLLYIFFDIKLDIIIYYNLNFYFTNWVYAIFCIRIASWFNNDIYGIQNKKTLRCYDTSLYEAYFTALFPRLIIPYLYEKQYFIEYYFYIYAVTRFIIEFKKKKYHNYPVNLTLGQLDCIFIIINNYLYYNGYKGYLLTWIILYYDFNLRLLNYSTREFKYTIINYKKITLSILPTTNKWFSLGKFKDIGFYTKCIINIFSLIITYLLSSNIYLLLFGLLNLYERIYLNYVNDYLYVRIYKFRFICNISDISMFLLINYISLYN